MSSPSSGRVRRAVLRVPALASLAPGSGGAVACHALDLGRAVMCGCSVGAARMSELVAAAPAAASHSASAAAAASAPASAPSSVSVSTLIAEGDSDADEADAVARALVLAFENLGSCCGDAEGEGGGGGEGGKLVLLSWNVPAGLPPLAREAVRRAFLAWAAPAGVAASRDAEAWVAAEEAVRAAAGSGGEAITAR